MSAGEGAYPREWFRVSSWTSTPEPRLFVRETEHMLFYHSDGEERREAKSGSYETWYPTLEEAQAAIERRKARENVRLAIRLKQVAAEDLFDALQATREDLVRLAWEENASIIERIDAALNKALGK